MPLEPIQQLQTLTDLIDGPGQPPTPPPTPDPVVGDVVKDKVDAAGNPIDVTKQDPPPPADPTKKDPPVPDTPKEGDDVVDPDEETVEDFFKKVDALHGEDIFTQVPYNGVDPMSPEGFVIRDQYIETKAQADFERSIMNSDPRAYAYLLHRQNGGSDESFFEVRSFVLPAIETLENDVNLQRTVVTEALKAKGVSEKQTAVILKASTDSGELLADAKAAYKEIQDRDSAVAASALKANEKRVAQQRADIQAIDAVVNNVILEGKELRFQIPDSEKNKFAQAFKGNIHYEDGSFYYIKPLTRDSISKVMETELFAYLGGDLGKMIEKAATSVSAQRFIKKAKAADDGKNKSSIAQDTGVMTLGQL